jgi:inosine/xanthosine triphosphate pyrophosphatase family protein
MSNKTKIIFVTSNENKFKDAQEFINSNFIIINEKLDLLEIQSTDNIEVMKYKIEEAYNKIINMEKYKSDIDNINVICEDTGLICENMHTFPGALIKFYLENVGITGISKYNGNSNSTAISVIGLKNKFDVQIFKGERT